MNLFTRNLSLKKILFHDSFTNQALKLSWLESILASVVIGIYFENILWGLGACFVLILLEGIPLISCVYSLLFSLMEAVVIGKAAMHFLPVGPGSLAALAAFMLLAALHKRLGKINCTALGFAMIVGEEILVVGLVYLLKHQIQLSDILILAGIFLLTCIAFCRIAAAFLLTIAVTGLLYLYGRQFLDPFYLLLFVVLTFCYSGTIYLWAWLGNDYLGLWRQRRFQKLLAAKEKELPDIKSRMYEKYPVLAEQYQYYQTCVCNDSTERQEFDTDWKHYLIYLDSASRNITFNQFFERERLYQIRTYKQNPYRTNPYHSAGHTKKHTGQGIPSSSVSFDRKNESSYFAGVHDMKSLKKRYHDLLKIYHPDNLNGDSTVSRQIQEEYDALSKKFQ